MRDIKFRAKAMSKKYTDWNYGLVRSIAKDGTGFLQDEHRNCVHINIETLSQYIGHKDVNDKEVYEGDIVEAYYTVDGIYEAQEFEPGVIQWNKSDCLYEIKFADDTAPIYHYSSLKIVGNIYDNPELLEDRM